LGKVQKKIKGAKTMKVYSLIIALGFCLAAPSAFADYRYVSVAGATLPDGNGGFYGHIGKGWSDSDNDAQEQALSACGDDGCRVLETSTGCIATAYDNSRIVYASSDNDVENAQNTVINYCISNSSSGGCVSWETVCANGYDSGS
jgi:hypothetical protein